MTADDQASPPPPARPIVLSPRLVAICGFVLYGLTLNHWVTLRSLPMLAQVTGWDWHPLPLPWREEPMAPLFLALTAPFRLLPIAWQPVALNLLTAVCAALTLGLLADSVRWLPHNRTPDQRLRQTDPNALLPIRAAFLPALFAVLMLAGQLTFWQNAVAATGEMLNLLLFAFVIDCLLRYRISRNDKWLLASVFAYGLGDANDWAFLAFSPFYFLALLSMSGAWASVKELVGHVPTVRILLAQLWARAVKSAFLRRLILCALAGHLLYLLVPLVGVITGGGDFSYLFVHQFGLQRFGLLHSVPRWVVAMAVGCSLLPLLLATLRWADYLGYINRLGNRLNRLLLHASHLVGLALPLMLFFDFKYSPGLRLREQPVSFLTAYYLGALAIGYFSGYVLSVLGGPRAQNGDRARPGATWLNFASVALIWVLTLGGATLLAAQNFPRLRAGQSGALEQFSSQCLAALPSGKAIVLSDDPGRLYLLQAAGQRHGLPDNKILIETGSFPHREYIDYLIRRHPELKSAVTTNLATLPALLPKETVIPFMALVMHNFPRYYLQASFGYYGEAFYFKPHGPVYELLPFNTSALQPPLPTEAEIAANQAFWSKLENGPLKPIFAAAKLDTDAAAVSADYAVSLDFFGTELQKANHLKEAHEQFAEAARLNTNNFIARINLQYNERLQKGDRRPLDSGPLLYEAMYRFRGLGFVLKYNGPPDEPGMDLTFGMAMADGGQPGQAARLFDRRLQLLPGDAEAGLAMAKCYITLHQPAKTLALVRQLRGSTNVSAWDLDRCEAVACMAAQDYASAEKILRDALRQAPNDANRPGALAEFYRARGLDELALHKNTEASRDFGLALTNINLQLQMLSSPSRDVSADLRLPDCLLRKAEIQTRLQSYDTAAATLTKVLQLQPDNYLALLNRAAAEIQIKQFQAAKDDYKKLGKMSASQPFMADLGLADVAAAEKDVPEEIARLRRCVQSAPEDSGIYQIARQRLAKLQGR
jgi:tetratricopeptide (TPR) repeat protein